MEDDKKIKLLQVKEVDENGKLISIAVEKNMMASAKYDGDLFVSQIMSGKIELGDDPFSKALGFKKDQFDNLFEDASDWFDRNGIITSSSISQISEPSYVFTSIPNTIKVKQGLLGKFISWMKKKLKNM